MTTRTYLSLSLTCSKNSLTDMDTLSASDGEEETEKLMDNIILLSKQVRGIACTIHTVAGPVLVNNMWCWGHHHLLCDGCTTNTCYVTLAPPSLCKSCHSRTEYVALFRQTLHEETFVTCNKATWWPVRVCTWNFACYILKVTWK